MIPGLHSASDIRNAETQQSAFRLRLVAMGALVLICFSLLVWRWSVLQIARHDTYLEQAERNRTALLPIVPSRGQILDRNGIVLATNYSAYTLELTPSKIDDVDDTINALAEIIPITEADRRRFNRLRQDSRSFEAVPLRSRLSDEEIARFSAQRYRFPGVAINARLYRYYPYTESASHLIGYIGRINQREKEAIEDSDLADNYKGTEHIGKLGVEQAYEEQLHGISGREQMETTAGGFVVRRLASSPSSPGQNVILSVDIKLQMMVEQLFGKRRGALVAIDPRDGQVLALVSSPTFDPNLFVDGIDHDSWNALNTSPDTPLLNRAIRGTIQTHAACQRAREHRFARVRVACQVGIQIIHHAGRVATRQTIVVHRRSRLVVVRRRVLVRHLEREPGLRRVPIPIRHRERAHHRGHRRQRRRIGLELVAAVRLRTQLACTQVHPL